MLYSFKNNITVKEGKCEIDVFGNVVIVTQLSQRDEPGPDINKITCTLAKGICEKYKIKYEKLILIEKWFEHHLNQGDYYMLTKLKIDDDEITRDGFASEISFDEVIKIIYNQPDFEMEVRDSMIDDMRRLKSRINMLQKICNHSNTKLKEDNKVHCIYCDVIID